MHFFDGVHGPFVVGVNGQYRGPQIWDFRPDDNKKVRILKERIQEMAWEAISSIEIEN